MVDNIPKHKQSQSPLPQIRRIKTSGKALSGDGSKVKNTKRINQISSSNSVDTQNLLLTETRKLMFKYLAEHHKGKISSPEKKDEIKQVSQSINQNLNTYFENARQAESEKPGALTAAVSKYVDSIVVKAFHDAQTFTIRDIHALMSPLYSSEENIKFDKQLSNGEYKSYMNYTMVELAKLSAIDKEKLSKFSEADTSKLQTVFENQGSMFKGFSKLSDVFEAIHLIDKERKDLSKPAVIPLVKEGKSDKIKYESQEQKKQENKNQSQELLELRNKLSDTLNPKIEKVMANNMGLALKAMTAPFAKNTINTMNDLTNGQNDNEVLHSIAYEGIIEAFKQFTKKREDSSKRDLAFSTLLLKPLEANYNPEYLIEPLMRDYSSSRIGGKHAKRLLGDKSQNIAPKKIEEAKNAKGIRFNDAVDQNGNSVSPYPNKVPEGTSPNMIDPNQNPMRDMITEDWMNTLDEVLATVTHLERDVTNLKYGTYGQESTPRDEVVKIFNLDEKRIKKIENRTIRKLRHRYRLDHISNAYFGEPREIKAKKKTPKADVNSEN